MKKFRFWTTLLTVEYQASLVEWHYRSHSHYYLSIRFDPFTLEVCKKLAIFEAQIEFCLTSVQT